jgi:hypothetical protein
MARAAAQKPEISEDRAFQERFWTAERVAWVVFALLIIGAVAGVFGSGGPVASGTVTVGESRIEYPAVARWEAGDEFSIRLVGEAGERRLLLSSTFGEAFRIDDVQPQPARVEAVDVGHAYVFPAMSDAPVEIHLDVTPRRPGYATYAIGDGTAPPARLSTFVWP